MFNNFAGFLPELLVVLWLITIVVRVNHRLTKLEKHVAAMQDRATTQDSSR